MTRPVATALAGALALVSLSACGSVQQAGRVSGPSTSTSTSATTPTTTPPTTTPTTKGTTPMPAPATGPPDDLTMPPAKDGKHSTVRVRGTVSDGVESGCTLLTSNGVVYLLLGQHGTPLSGGEIEVEGTIQPDRMTTCQQGTPLVVERILSP